MAPKLNWLQHKSVSACFSQSQVFAYPTESVYGLGCSPFDEHAVLKLSKLKARPKDKGYIIVSANLDQLTCFLQQLSSSEKNKLAQSSSKNSTPRTWVVPSNAYLDYPWLFGKNKSIAVRVSQHSTVQALCTAFGPLVSTSANLKGQPPCIHAWQVQRIFNTRIGFIVHDKVGHLRKPTPIINLVTGRALR